MVALGLHNVNTGVKQMTLSDTDKLQEIGKGAYAAISALVEALRKANAQLDDDDADNNNYKTHDEAYEAIQEDALSVEVREDWHPVGQSSHEADKEYRILITTGGPAVQIWGELNRYNEPANAFLQVQDWFLPWTNVEGCDADVLLEYAQCFYFGE
jgi:hypothetical protein